MITEKRAKFQNKQKETQKGLGKKWNKGVHLYYI